MSRHSVEPIDVDRRATHSDHRGRLGKCRADSNPELGQVFPGFPLARDGGFADRYVAALTHMQAAVVMSHGWIDGRKPGP